MMRTSQRALPPPPIVVTKPLYLRDPETKALLREAVATPERFDETLNFGFRREPSTPLISPATQLKPHNWSDVMATTSYEDDDPDVDLSSADEDSGPLTPDFIAPRIVRSGSDCLPVLQTATTAAPSPKVGRALSNTSYFEELMNRDMTLRMTLTKPELQATEEELYGWRDRTFATDEGQAQLHVGVDDPLALEQLTYSDDVTGAYGPFANVVSGKKKAGIKGLWFRR